VQRVVGKRIGEQPTRGLRLCEIVAINLAGNRAEKKAPRYAGRRVEIVLPVVAYALGR
jgi:hypothetical protein